LLIKDILRYSGSMGEIGRPAHDDDWYRKRLDEMRPILCLGNSIRYAAEKVAIGMHKTVLYEKYGKRDWFADKVDEYRAMPGELINDIVISLATTIKDKVTLGKPLNREDIDIIKLVAEKHRSAQPFFVTKVETSEANPDDVGKILDKIENDYTEVRREAKKQMVANDAPVQNKGQAGQDSAVQPESATVATPH